MTKRNTSPFELHHVTPSQMGIRLEPSECGQYHAWTLPTYGDHPGEQFEGLTVRWSAETQEITVHCQGRCSSLGWSSPDLPRTVRLDFDRGLVFVESADNFPLGELNVRRDTRDPNYENDQQPIATMVDVGIKQHKQAVKQQQMRLALVGVGFMLYSAYLAYTLHIWFTVVRPR